MSTPLGLFNVEARYLIVGPTRSGTTAIHVMLGGHPDVSFLVGELSFSKLAAGIGGFSVKGYVTEQEESLGRAALFDAITGATRSSRTRVLGAKTTVNSKVAADRFVDTVREYLPDVKIIAIVRRDMVAHYHSRLQLKKTGVAHSWQKNGSSPVQSPIHIGKWLLAKNALATLDMYEGLRVVGNYTDYMEIDYEAFAEDNDRTYRQLLEFLGLEYCPPDWHTATKLHDSPETSIRNYKQLSSYVTSLADAYLKGELSPIHVRAIKTYAKVRQKLRGRKRKSLRE